MQCDSMRSEDLLIYLKFIFINILFKIYLYLYFKVANEKHTYYESE
jgi:hypothetical protein